MSEPAPSPERPPPGAKRARHKRRTRIAAAVTAATLVAFGAALAYGLKVLVKPKTEAERQAEGFRNFLDGIAEQVRKFEASRKRLPQSLQELRDPELDSVYDAEPLDTWGQPVHYRVLSDGTSFVLHSFGPDGKPDTADDVVREDPRRR